MCNVFKNNQRDVQLKQSVERCPTGEITDAKVAQETVENCIREMAKVKAFLEDDNSWWKILKSRSLNCCQQKVPHLHGHLDGTSVTLMLLEEDTDEVRLSLSFFLSAFFFLNFFAHRESHKSEIGKKYGADICPRQI